MVAVQATGATPTRTSSENIVVALAMYSRLDNCENKTTAAASELRVIQEPYSVFDRGLFREAGW